MTIYEVAEELGISYDACQDILTDDLGMRHVLSKFIAWLQTEEQKGTNLSVSSDLFDCDEIYENILKNKQCGSCEADVMFHKHTRIL